MRLFENLFNKAYDYKTIDKIKFLSNVILFKGIKRKDLLYLLEHIYEKTYQKGEVIFIKGDIGKALFIVYKGKIELYKDTELKNKVTEVCEGEFVGEMALLEEMPRALSAVAAVESQVFMLYKTELESMIKSKPEIASVILYNISKVLSARLRSMIEND